MVKYSSCVQGRSNAGDLSLEPENIDRNALKIFPNTIALCWEREGGREEGRGREREGGREGGIK